MRRINSAENARVEAGTGINIWGPPNPPQPNCIISPDYMNLLQEEICNVIESAGITLDGSKRNQLLAAIPKIRQITANLTLNVGTGYPDYTDGIHFLTIQEALDSLEGRLIATAANVTIMLKVGTHAQSAPLRIRLRQGQKVTIQGTNVSTPYDSIISFPAVTLTNRESYIQLDPGASIRFKECQITGRTNSASFGTYLIKAGRGNYIGLDTVELANNRGSMALAEEGGIIEGYLLSTIGNVVTGISAPASWGVSFHARANGIIKGSVFFSTGSQNYSFLAEDDGFMFIGATNITDRPVFARRGGRIYGQSFNNVGQSARAAFQALEGGFLNLESSSVGTVGVAYGFLAQTGGKIVAKDSTATSCDFGYAAAVGAEIILENCTSAGNNVGYSASERSYIYANGSAGTATTTLKTPAAGTNSADQSRMG